MLNMADGNELGDWRFECSSASEKGMKTREIKNRTDVTFLVGPDESDEMSFSTHKIVLAVSSPVFEVMFYGSVAQTENPIIIRDVDPDVFEMFLLFMYIGKANFSTVSQAGQCYMLATTYRVDDLKATAEDYVAKYDLNESKFWELANNKQLMKIPIIKKKCLKYISKNADTVFQSYLFLNLSLDIVEEIVKIAEISDASEFDLLSAMIRWSMANVQSGMTVRIILKPLLEFIRFSNLSIDDFCSFLDSHPGLIDADDALMIMKHLTKPEIYKLPQWCSSDQQKRN